MNFVRASFHFATATLSVYQDGYLCGAVENLRAMLLDTGAISAEAFERANFHNAFGTKDPAGDPGTRFRYTFEGENVRAEERLVKGEEQWKELFNGPVLDLVNNHGAMLHALGPNPVWSNALRYATLATLEADYAQAEARRLRHEAGIVSLGGRLAAGQADELRQQVLSAMRAEVAAGHVAPAIA